MFGFSAPCCRRISGGSFPRKPFFLYRTLIALAYPFYYDDDDDYYYYYFLKFLQMLLLLVLLVCILLLVVLLLLLPLLLFLQLADASCSRKNRRRFPKTLGLYHRSNVVHQIDDYW